ncbi:MAG: hypothetical protein WBB70_15155 [Desulfobacterales bacterium]
MKDDLVIKEIRQTRKTFCQEFRFDVKRIAKALKEREQMHPDSIRIPRAFPVKKMAV